MCENLKQFCWTTGGCNTLSRCTEFSQHHTHQCLTVGFDLVPYVEGHLKVDDDSLLKDGRCDSGFCIYLQGRRLDIADVAMRTGTLWVDALKASPRVDTSCPSATVVLLA